MFIFILRDVTMDQLFHISFRDNLPNTLVPRIPDDEEEEQEPQEVHEFSENLPLRVCFSPTVQQCFLAVYPNVFRYFEEDNYPHMDFYVYAYARQKTPKFIQPEELHKKVWDSQITGEVSFISPVKVIKVAKIRFYNNPKAIEVYGHPFGDTKRKKQFLGPLSDFDIIETYAKNIPLQKVTLSDITKVLKDW